MEHASFEQFYRDHRRLVVDVARRRLGSSVDAEDAAADVFRIAWAHHSKGNELTLPWVFATLRHVVGTEYRRVGRARNLAEKIGALRPGDDLTAPSLEEALALRRHLAGLRPDDRRLVIMTYWADLSSTQVAEILGCGPIVVRVRLHRIRRTLRGRIDAAARPDPM